MFIIKFDTSNAAFQEDIPGVEIARIIRAIADVLDGSSDNTTDVDFSVKHGGPVHDYYGNTIGAWSYEPETV